MGQVHGTPCFGLLGIIRSLVYCKWEGECGDIGLLPGNDKWGEEEGKTELKHPLWSWGSAEV